MDYKQRKYYLVRFSYADFNYRMQMLKICVPSVRLHKPYNHFKSCEGFDFNATQNMQMPVYWQMMVSCYPDHEEALLYELRKAKRNDDYGCDWMELTQSVCGQ